MRVATTELVPGEIFYPSSNGEPMAETEAHLFAMIALIAALRTYFLDTTTYVVGDMLWYYEEGNPRACRAPDVMVVHEADPPPPGGRTFFKSWEEGADPCWVMEFSSPNTIDEDLGPKKDLFERLGVREYFLFDPRGECLDPPLIGYRLINGVYEELRPAADGSLPSAELAMRLKPEGRSVTLWVMKTGLRLPESDASGRAFREVMREIAETRERAAAVERALSEQTLRADAEQARADEAEKRAGHERIRAAEEKARADAEKTLRLEQAARADALEAELRRLRGPTP